MQHSHFGWCDRNMYITIVGTSRVKNGAISNKIISVAEKAFTCYDVERDYILSK